MVKVLSYCYYSGGSTYSFLNKRILKYILSLAVPLLLLFMAYAGGTSDAVAINDYQYDTISDMIRDCEGSNGLGGSCEAKCSGGCKCSTGLFKCKCGCEETTEAEDMGNAAPDKDIHWHVTPAPASSWEKMLAIVGSEETQNAKEIYQQIETLRTLGEQEEYEKYDALADIMEEKVMTLQPETLEAIVLAFAG